MAFKVLPNLQATERSFVEQLISRHHLKSGFRSILAGKTLEEIEVYLLTRKLINEKDLAKEYAHFFHLPLVHLTDKPIDSKVIHLIPMGIAEQYRVLPYDVKGTDIYLAIGKPSKLQQDAPRAISAIRQQKGLRVHLAIVPEAELLAIIKKTLSQDVSAIKAQVHDQLKLESEKTLPAPKEDSEPVDTLPKSSTKLPQQEEKKDESVMVDTPQPIRSLNKEDLIKEVEPRNKHVDLKALEIPQSVITKIPLEVAKKYKIVVFGSAPPKSALEPPLIKVAAIDPDDSHVKEILTYIEERNKVLVDRYITDPASFEKALTYYNEVNPEPETEQKPQPLTVQLPEPVEPPPKPVLPVEVVTEPIEPVITAEPSLSKVEPVSPYPAETVKGADALPEEKPKVTMPSSEDGIAISAQEITSRPTETASELQVLAKQQEASLEDQNLDKLLKQKVLSPQDLANVFKTGVIPEIVAATLFLAIRMKASDIHIEAEQDSVRLRFRIDGVLHDILRVPAFLQAPLASRIKILSKMKIDEQRVPQDGRFDVVIDSRQVDLRVSTMPTVHGEKVVMRLLDKSEGIKTLEQLGVTGTNFDTLISNINKPYGIILSTGPTGSGKSTTLYAILTRISKPGVNIITLEDPVEYELPGINQAQVKPQIGFTFAEGLRSVLRQDPNVIMVGEIRDLETAAMATHAALTGHLVLSTLHTNDSAGALPRLIDMGVEPFLITSSINAVIGQRLVRKICDNCREKAEIPPAVKNFVQKELAAVPSGQLKDLDMDQLVFYHGRGCPNCTNGYRGRIGIFEVLPMSEKIEELAVRRAPASELKRQAIHEGMITMMQDGLMKALKGITTLDEVLRVTTASIKEMPGG